MGWPLNDPPAPDDPALTLANALQRRVAGCERLLSAAPEFALSRWNEKRQSFVDTEDRSPGPHLVNTATACLSIGRTANLFAPDQLERFAYHKSPVEMAKFFGPDGFRGDGFRSKDEKDATPYSTAMPLLAVGAFVDRKAKPKVEFEEGERAAFEQDVKYLIDDHLAKWVVNDVGNYDHAFFAVTALEAVEQLGPVVGVDHKRIAEVSAAVVRRLEKELYSQLSFALAKMTPHLDAATFIMSFCAVADRGTALTDLPDDVFDVALDAIMALQDPATGMWDTSSPLVGTESGRVGCSSLELAGRLLRLERMAPRFERTYPQFDRLLKTLEAGFDPSKPGQGWAVDVRRTGRQRQTWYGFYAFEFIALFASSLRALGADVVLRGYSVRRGRPKVSWEDLGEYHGFKQRVDDDVLGPRLGKSAAVRKSSMIMFGPPGTGKTTIAHAIAGKLGWNLVELGPGDFLARGTEGIFAQTDAVFQRLVLLDDVVVLFDEVDEMVISRDQNADKLSKFLTTYMLPWLQQLRSKNTIIFIFATNHIEVFDSAIKRVGRFDLVLPIGPPVEKERVRVVKGMLKADEIDVDDDTLAAVCEGAVDRTSAGEIAAALSRGVVLEGGRRRQKRAADAILKDLNPERLAASAEEWETFLVHRDFYRLSDD